MMNEGSPPALPEVIESLPKVKLTKEQVGKSGLCLLEWFSVERRKTKTKVITLANHKEHTQYSEPIKTRSNYR